ncbi:MAG: hypothetical protein J5589_01810 [Firmicutes bacterium]|nr:hypothetical protein [Bacillota bacterium]
MKKTWFILFLVLLMIFSAGCMKTDGIEDRDKGKDIEKEEESSGDEVIEVPEFSSKYFVGTYYGGSSWGEYYDCLSAELIICTDHTVLVYMPTKVENYSAEDWGLIATVSLTDEQYQNIENAIDREELYLLDPDPEMDVCDGYSLYLMLYGTDERMVKRCGGYMPQNKRFNAMHDSLFANLPREELSRIRDEQVEKLRSEAESLISGGASESEAVEETPPVEESQPESSQLVEESQAESSETVESSEPESSETVETSQPEASEPETSAPVEFVSPTIVKITSSSELDESNLGLDHSGAMICDGSLENAWCEGVDGYGENEWVKVEFDGSYYIQKMEIYAGYHKSEKLFAENSRPKELLIVFDGPDGVNSVLVPFEDVMKSQVLTFDPVHYATSVTIYIQSVYKGTEFEDTLISEVIFN